jgi:hypothetical protein
MADIVPFGKYKNQPLEVLAQDAGYCEWLAGQGWVAQRYPEIHTLIINNFADPSETPEHNALQLCFLEEALRLKVTQCLVLVHQPRKQWFRDGHYLPLFASCGDPLFEENGIDVQWHSTLWYPTYDHSPRYKPDGTYTGRSAYVWEKDYLLTIVECKPSLGDDYPAVLRFLHPFGGYKALVVQDYAFRGGTVEQVQKLFQLSHVLLLDMPSLHTLPQIRCFRQEELPSAEDYCAYDRSNRRRV